METHPERRETPQTPEARAARSHGTVEPEHGASAVSPDTGLRIPGTARRVPATVAAPIVAALAFGCFTIFRTHTAGIKGGQAVLYGLATAVVTGALGLYLVHFQRTMITETRAVSYGALFGASIGWVYSLGGESVLKSTGFGLGMGAVMFVVSLYVFRTHRIREPHGLHRPHPAHRTRLPQRVHAAH
ncbi:hypothetical protein [Streptomyces natalensis]|uniref:Uncharacterized protein n=1 Tax=Streptomyces natalensis ATCC 27448 TaxID=1240678 RepID=A0A0D7CSM7_9ACTN|nr:hypothetical protein [Streptomyces natalensis]KIZ19066.1 hypothetical protein SNA_04955 [Streptomyces natalensis ATCC 27448]